MTGAADKELGHATDVAKLLKETGSEKAQLWVIGKKEGYSHDYDHINLLTHPDAPHDHFKKVLAWLQQN